MAFPLEIVIVRGEMIQNIRSKNQHFSFNFRGSCCGTNDFMLNLIEGFKAYLESMGQSVNTIESYLSDLNKFHVFCQELFAAEHVQISEINADFVKHYLMKLSQQKLTKRTIARNTTSLRMFFKYLVLYDIIPTNHLQNIKSPKFIAKLPMFFTPSEIDDLCEMPDSDTLDGVRDRAILELFYSSGLRISELMNARTRDIDFAQKTITVIGKGRKKRIVPLTDVALEFMQKYLNIRDINNLSNTDIFFLTAKKKPFKRHQLYNLAKKYIANLSLYNGYSPHTLRHSFASHLLSNGADIYAIKEMLGHASLTTTEIYTHISPEIIRAEYLRGHPRSNAKFEIKKPQHTQ